MPKYPIEYLKIFNKECVKPLSDPSFQERVWLKGLGPEVSSIDEAITSFLERCEIFIEYADQQEGLQKEHIKMLRDLYDKVDDYRCSHLGVADDKEVERVLSDPKWHKIQHEAKAVYEAIKTIYEP